MEAIPLDPSLKKQVLKAYTRAFFDYPMFTFYYPHPLRRERYLAAHLEIQVNYCFRYGQNYTTQELQGVSCWLPPGFTDTTGLRLIGVGGLSVIPRIGLVHYWDHVLKHDLHIVRVHKELMPGAHYYLWGIGVDPDYQGMGVGKSLMKPGLDQADAQGVPVYLETHAEKNIPYYQELGFDIVRRETLPDFELKFWCMLRPARSS